MWRFLSMVFISQSVLAVDDKNIDNSINGRAVVTDLVLVIDGFGYQISSDFLIDLSTQSLIVVQSSITNCVQQGNGMPPLNNANFTFTSNSEFIGVDVIQYALGRNAIILSSESDDVLCDNATIFDRIFIDGFEG